MNLPEKSLNQSQPLHNRREQSFASSARVAELDGLRGFAVLLVVACHYIYSSAHATHGFGAFVAATLRLSWSGVDLFFVLSGFLIGGILIDARCALNYFKPFYIRRACRIVPLYALLCLAFWVGRHLFYAQLPAALQELFKGDMPLWVYATMTQNFWFAAHASFDPILLAVTWSLAVEEQLYLTLPFLIRRASLVAALRWALIVIAAAPFARLICWSFGVTWMAISTLAWFRADALALGLLAAILVRRPSALAFISARRKMHNKVLLALFAVVAFITYMDFNRAQFEMIFLGYTALALFYFALLLAAVVYKDHKLNAIWRAAALRRLGAISYCVYLIHQPVNFLTHYLWRRSYPSVAGAYGWVVTLAAFALTLLLAQLSFNFIEQPILRFGRRFSFDATKRDDERAPANVAREVPA